MMLKTTYCVIVHPNGVIDWGADGPPSIPVTMAFDLVPTVHEATPRPKLKMPDETPEERAARGARLRAALEALAASNPFRDIVDPVEWQRETRKDRPLPGRADCGYGMTHGT
jgi:hypothetical protein